MQKFQMKSALVARIAVACTAALLVGITSVASAQVIEGTVAGHELRIEALEDGERQTNTELTAVRAQTECLARAEVELRAILATKASAVRVIRLEKWKDETTKALAAMGVRIEGLEKAVATAQAAIDSQGALIALVKTKVDELGGRVSQLEAKIARFETAIAEVGAQAERAERKADKALDTKQDRIEFIVGGAAWMKGVGGVVGITIPVRKHWAIEGVFGAGKGPEGFATLGQIVAMRRWIIDSNTLALRFGGYWSSDSLTRGTRAFAEKMVGGTVGFGYTISYFDAAIDLGGCWDAPQQKGVIKDQAAFCGVFRVGARF